MLAFWDKKYRSIPLILFMVALLVIAFILEFIPVKTNPYSNNLPIYEKQDEKLTPLERDQPKKVTPKTLNNEMDMPKMPLRMPGNYERAAELLEDYLLENNMDRELAYRILKRTRKDLMEQKGGFYDMKESIRQEMGENYSEQDINRVYDLTLAAAKDSFDEMAERED